MDKVNREMLFHLESLSNGENDDEWGNDCREALEQLPFSGTGSWGEHIRKITKMVEIKRRGK